MGGFQWSTSASTIRYLVQPTVAFLKREALPFNFCGHQRFMMLRASTGHQAKPNLRSNACRRPSTCRPLASRCSAALRPSGADPRVLFTRPDLAMEGSAEEWDPASALRSYTAAAAQHPRLYNINLSNQLRQDARAPVAAAATAAVPKSEPQTITIQQPALCLAQTGSKASLGRIEWQWEDIL